MMPADPRSRPPHPRPHIRFPFQRPRRLTKRRLLLSSLLFIVVLSGVIAGWSTGVFSSHAAGPLTSDPATMTFDQFLKGGRQDSTYRGPVTFPTDVAPPPGKGSQHNADYATLPPSAEPATMQPITSALDATFLAGSAAAAALDLTGSDGRLDVQIQPGSLDLTHATSSSGSAPVGALSVHLVQIYGHSSGQKSLLGSYQMQLLDSQNNVVNGLVLHAPRDHHLSLPTLRTGGSGP